MLASRIEWTAWIVALGVVSQASAQTIELQSVQTSVLNGSERERFLTAHNNARKKIGVGLVQWSDEVSNIALESLVQQKDALIASAKADWSKGRAVLPQHRTDNHFGENVAGSVGIKNSSAELAVTFWLTEKAAFDKLNALAPYRVGDEKDKIKTDAAEIGAAEKEHPIVVGHYTAIVWKSTKFIGAAKLTFDLTDDHRQS